MNRELIITKYKDKILSALFEEGRLCELFFDEEEPGCLIGDIYIAKVKNISKSIAAAFLDIGEGHMGYYSLVDNKDHHFVNVKNSDKLTEGDELLVQIVGDNLKTKQLILSSKISFQASSCVYFPMREENRISKKIKDEDHKVRLNTLLESCESKGFTLRTVSQELDDSIIVSEMAELEKKADAVMKNYRNRSCFSLIHRGDSAYMEKIKRYRWDSSLRIQTDIKEICHEIEEYLGHDESGMAGPSLELYSDDTYPLIKLKSLETLMEKAVSKKVWLDSGAYLIIESTEAMTVIDVNSGKNIKRKDKEKTFLETNLEAVKEALRQLRIRNISGMIVIDLINMRSEEDRRQVLRAAKSKALSDPVQTTVLDITALQLLEITRKKSRRPLRDMMPDVKKI